MGECMSKAKAGPQDATQSSAAEHTEQVSHDANAPALAAEQSAARQASPAERASAPDNAQHREASSVASSDGAAAVSAAQPRTSQERHLQTGASSDDSRTPAEVLSPVSSLRRSQGPGTTPAAGAPATGAVASSNASLTESNLHELNQASSVRRGKPSSTGGTTANTRPEDAPDMPELSEIPEAADVPRSPRAPEAAGIFTSIDAASATPPPVAEGLPVVSLQDIAVMEQKQGRRGRRRPSRRGSTTASHASLSAIPENVEITPLHARSERSDSMRPMGGHPVSRLADVQELDVRAPSSRTIT